MGEDDKFFHEHLERVAKLLKKKPFWCNNDAKCLEINDNSLKLPGSGNNLKRVY